MSIDNISTNYTSLVKPLVTRSVIASALIDGGVLSSGSTVSCSGVFGEGDLIANIQSIDNTSNLVVSANGNNPDKNGIISTIPPGLQFGSGEILFTTNSEFIDLFAISNNLLSVGISYDNYTNIQNLRGIVYNQYGNKYNINTNNYNIGFSDLKNNDIYTYICGGILLN
jgi:hypothetical protein